jgi:hypothetical protein
MTLDRPSTRLRIASPSRPSFLAVGLAERLSPPFVPAGLSHPPRQPLPPPVTNRQRLQEIPQARQRNPSTTPAPVALLTLFPPLPRGRSVSEARSCRPAPPSPRARTLPYDFAPAGRAGHRRPPLPPNRPSPSGTARAPPPPRLHQLPSRPAPGQLARKSHASLPVQRRAALVSGSDQQPLLDGQQRRRIRHDVVLAAEQPPEQLGRPLC